MRSEIGRLGEKAKNDKVEENIEMINMENAEITITNIKKVVEETWVSEQGFVFNFEPVDDSITITETETGYKAKYLSRDEDPLNPRNEFDNFGVMVCYHRRYNLGDGDEKKNPYVKMEFDGWDELREKILEDNPDAIIYPMYMLDHSGLTVSIRPFNDRWDSGKIGYIFVSKEDVIKEFGDFSDESQKKAQKILKGEVETYDDYMTGEVYSCVVETYDKEKNSLDYDIVGGYYGYKYSLQALKEEY